MNILKRNWLIVAVVLFLAVTIIGVQSKSFFASVLTANQQNSTKIIKIGVITPLTGEAAAWGTWVQKSMDLAYGEINNPNIKLIYEDDKCDPKTGVDAYIKLTTIDHVDMITGQVCSSVTLAIEPLAKKDNIPLITTGASATSLRGAGDQLFNLYSLNDVSSIYIANYLTSIKVNKAAILYVNNDFGVTLRDGFKTQFEKNGGIITDIESIDQTSTDVRTQLAKIKQSGPEYVFLATYYNNAAYAMKQNNELGYGLKTIGTLDTYNDKVRAIAGDAVIGHIYSRAKANDSKVSTDFINNYQAKYGEKVDVPGDTAYDAIYLINDAIKSGKSIGDYLLSVKNYVGASGKFSVDENGDAVIDQEMVTITK